MPQPWLSRRILNYAHQGGAREAPSSTMHAFRQAVANGADALEMDVHATRDGELVVCHDESVDRTTPSHGRIASLTLDELRRLDNAYWWVPGEQTCRDADPADYVLRGRAPDDRSLGIATLREILQEFPATYLNLDIKETAPVVDGYETALAAMLAEFGRTDDVIVASFHDEAIVRFAAAAPGVHTSLATLASTVFWAWANDSGPRPATGPTAVALQVPVEIFGITVVDARFVERAHECDLAVHVWTIDDEATMRLLIDLGVDGIITDVPSVLTRVLKERIGSS